MIDARFMAIERTVRKMNSRKTREILDAVHGVRFDLKANSVRKSEDRSDADSCSNVTESVIHEEEDGKSEADS